MKSSKSPAGGVATTARLLKLARPEWPMLGAGMACLILGSSMSLIYPQAIRVIIDQALGQKNPHVIDQAALVMVAIFAVQGVAIGVRYVLFTTVGERVVARLRENLFQSILSQEIAFFDDRKTGELTNRLGSDTTVLQSTVSANISMGLRNLAGVVGGLGFLVYTSPKLTLLMLAVVPPVALGAMAYGRRVRKLSREVQDALAQSNEVAEESISGVRTVRAFTAEETEVKRYSNAVQNSYQLARRRAVYAGTFMGGATTAGYAAAAIVLWFGGRMVLRGEISVGALTSFLVYTMVVAFSLGALSDLWAELMKAAGAGERVFELLDRPASMPLRGGISLEHIRGNVQLERVGFAYPARQDVPVLNDVDLTLAEGEVVALVGPSGAGKSTVAAMLTRHYDPQRGRVLIDGVDIRTLDPGWLRRQIGTVAQEPILFSTTIAENIRYARPTATFEEIEAAARTANAHDFIQKFPKGYQTLVGERGVQLSGGQKQRVAIARAVLKDPRLLLLDEATSALDAESEHLVKEALDRLMKQRTTLIIAHRLSTVIDADRVLVLEGGRVIQSGSHAALMGEEGLYRRLVERQFVAA